MKSEQDSKKERISLIQELERTYDAGIIVYFLGDRPLSVTQIADDSIRPMYDHLLNLGKRKRIMLYLYGLGGLTETPWKIVTMIREFCEEFWVMIPYKAYSASTMICLGADKILMGRKGELGPIDPALQFAGGDKPDKLLIPEIGVEDVASYVDFLKNRVGLKDQDVLVDPIGTLATTLTPPLLGRIERIYSHIRLVARKLLLLHNDTPDETAIGRIIETLTEKSYAHGHGIGRKEAKQIGLKVEYPDNVTEDLIWELFKEYEDHMELSSNPDPFSYFADDGPDTYTENGKSFATIESIATLHNYSGNFFLQRIRKSPPQLNINFNINLQMPPSITPNQIPQQAQQILQQLLQQAQQQLQQQLNQEITKQMPVETINSRVVGGHWQKVI